MRCPALKRRKKDLYRYVISTALHMVRIFYLACLFTPDTFPDPSLYASMCASKWPGWHSMKTPKTLSTGVIASSWEPS